jgi:hypothetical protein
LDVELKITKNKKDMKTISVKVAGIFVAFAFAVTASSASALTTQELIDLLVGAGLVSSDQVASLTGGSTTTGGSSSACGPFTRDLTIGSTGSDVTTLQTFLEEKGALTIPVGVAKGYFGSLTQSALASWQASNAVSPAAGYFGPKTRAAVATMCGPVVDTGSTGSTGSSSSLSGGAGSITVDGSSKYSGEEVGEDEEDVEVLAFDVEADDDSDVQITSIKVELHQQTAAISDKLDDYVSEVSVWFDGEKVGEADADDFSENSDVYTKSISLDDVVIRAGDEERITLAVSALGNLDSGDIGTDDWQIGVSNVRFKDGDGVVTTESVTLDIDDDAVDQEVEQRFNFASFASASDVELKVSLGDEDINDARVLNLDSSDEEFEVLSFMIEAEGDSDLLITEIPVTVTTTGETDEAIIVIQATLYHGGEEIDSQDVPTGGAVTFDLDDGITIDAGDEEEFIVVVDMQEAGTTSDGDTVQVQLTTANVDDIEAEDEAGEDIADADASGSALADAHGLFDTGIMAEFVDSTSKATPSGLAGVDDFATFTIVFDVTAFDSNIYVDGSAITDEAGGATYQNIDADNIAATAVLESTADDAANDTFEVLEGTTERFTLTVSGSGDDVFANASLESILYATTAIDGDTLYTFSMEEFEADNVFVSGND